jgi:Rps23 Pro-64 3,4-dihydroxylase Tpa1-like proline 4-hydroxylase
MMRATLIHSTFTKFNPDAVRRDLDANGCVMLPPESVFSAQQLVEMEELCRALPEEVITLGDAGEPNNLYVGRFMVDKPGELPRLVNHPHSDRLMEILGQDRLKTFFQSILGGERFLRRCQINRMVAGSFIGRHLDQDSNPDYEISVVVQLGRIFGGGEFVVYADNETVRSFKPTYGTTIIARCSKEHEVAKVTSDERYSLVYFYSPQQAENRRAM